MNKQSLLRSLPQVEELLEHPLIEAILVTEARDRVVETVRSAIDDVRQGILDGTVEDVENDLIAHSAQLKLLALKSRSLRRVVNASGVIVHTNLGRSPLAQEAIAAVNDVIAGYSTLEYDTDAMARGSRHSHCERLLCTLTGAESAIAVNNNAAAVMMVLSEFARGHEAVVSRGEEVEIGGSFRIPDIMAQSGATMVEVGATNKTHLADYAAAISDNTSMLLKVHRSNFRLIGFTEEVSISDLRTMADAINASKPPEQPPVLVYEDQGSGAFMRLDCFGSYAEPTVKESLEAGADLISFSGDKLLGGPQAGIIAGRKDLIDRLKKNPLARALRLDKMTLAALEATLHLYLDPNQAMKKIPTLRMLTMTKEEARERANSLLETIKAEAPSKCFELGIEPCISRAGGGALPMCDIPSFAVSVAFKHGDALGCHRHMVSKRALPIVARICKEHLLLDVRTLLGEEEQSECAKALKEYAKTLER